MKMMMVPRLFLLHAVRARHWGLGGIRGRVGGAGEGGGVRLVRPVPPPSAAAPDLHPDFPSERAAVAESRRSARREREGEGRRRCSGESRECV